MRRTPVLLPSRQRTWRSALQRARGPGGSWSRVREAFHNRSWLRSWRSPPRQAAGAVIFWSSEYADATPRGHRPCDDLVFLIQSSRPDIGRRPSPTFWWTFVCAESCEDGLLREGAGATHTTKGRIPDVREGKAGVEAVWGQRAGSRGPLGFTNASVQAVIMYVYY